MGRLPEYIGKRFGSLTVIAQTSRPEGRSMKPRRFWLCRCDCDEHKVADSMALSKGHTTSCGCARFLKPNRWKGHGEIGHTYFTTIKRHARERGLSFDLTIEYLWDLFLKQDRKCALSQVPLVFEKMKRGVTTQATASVDRIDSSLGYFPGNVQWVHKCVNSMKLDLPQEEFIRWCKLIAAGGESDGREQG